MELNQKIEMHIHFIKQCIHGKSIESAIPLIKFLEELDEKEKMDYCEKNDLKDVYIDKLIYIINNNRKEPVEEKVPSLLDGIKIDKEFLDHYVNSMVDLTSNKRKSDKKDLLGFTTQPSKFYTIDAVFQRFNNEIEKKKLNPHINRHLQNFQKSLIKRKEMVKNKKRFKKLVEKLNKKLKEKDLTFSDLTIPKNIVLE